jgi:biopolymer transport protein ExbB/TolQ
LAWFAFIYFFQAPEGKPSSEFTTGETLANLFYKHFTVSFVNTLFFFWGFAILYLKLFKLKHQRRAMLLDVLPHHLGDQIDANNVGTFIDHVYGLPEKLRDSLMVNRIRKALEFFEVRQNVADVSTLMSSQSAIDGSRIMGSYIIVRAFLWAIPLLGFIGTVVGLSHAISSMSFNNVEDVSKIVGSINNVTSGLGTAFDATLLGLVFAVLINFPLNSLAKHEEEALNDIDAYCNEVLLPRLNDGAAEGAAKKAMDSKGLDNLGAMAELIVHNITSSQKEFLTDLNALSARMLGYADSLEHRNEQYQQAALQHLSEQMGALSERAQEQIDLAKHQQESLVHGFSSSLKSLEESSTSAYEKIQTQQSAILSRFSEQLSNVTNNAEKTLSESILQTQRTISDFSENLAKMQSSSATLQKTISESQETLAKSLVDKLSDKVSGIASSVETALASSLSLTHKTVANLSDQFGKLENASNDHLKHLASSQENLFKQISDKFSERLGSISSGVEANLNTSLQQTQRAISGFAEQVGKLEKTVQEQQQAAAASQDTSAKFVAERMMGISAGVESSLKASLQQAQQSIASLDSGIRSLNTVLEQLGARQVVVQQVKKKGWFSRD